MGILIVALLTEKGVACTDVSPSKVAAGISYMNCAGDIVTGTLETLPTCSSDGQQNCISSATAPAVNTTTIAAVDIVTGKSIAGVSGTFTPGSVLGYCRDGFNNTIYNNNGVPGNAASNSAGGGNAFDWWDTVDDFANSTTTTAPAGTPWANGFYCDGSLMTDVSSTQSWLTPSNSSFNCQGTTCTDANLFSKIIYDPLTELYLTNVMVEGTIAASTPCTGAGGCVSWSEAVSGCDNLNSGDGTNKWRLATQNEMIMLMVAGIWSRNAALFSGKLDDNFFGASTDSTDQTAVGVVNFKISTFSNNLKSNQSFGAFCVR